ncbi:MAG TPA: hypothetical protein PLV33_10825 [Opitutaceae bacterium]|nr:hypothetical protein [Opitutaceae bacterium]HOF10476.1 hypothetical protein [Opitutaceae bacterium]HOR25793.1 hypothetical protein [Opitutaceae bacterium]HPK50065.1 hypothetical protein [Opitutaceae bacterium]
MKASRPHVSPIFAHTQGELHFLASAGLTMPAALEQLFHGFSGYGSAAMFGAVYGASLVGVAVGLITRLHVQRHMATHPY